MSYQMEFVLLEKSVREKEEEDLHVLVFMSYQLTLVPWKLTYVFIKVVQSFPFRGKNCSYQPTVFSN